MNSFICIFEIWTRLGGRGLGLAVSGAPRMHIVFGLTQVGHLHLHGSSHEETVLLGFIKV